MHGFEGAEGCAGGQVAEGRQLMQIVPTPCNSKRAMDDFLLYRFHKRLRIEGPNNGGAACVDSANNNAALANAVAATAAVPVSETPRWAYGDMNSFLQQLHVEQMARRSRLPSIVSSEMVEDCGGAGGSSTAAAAPRQPLGNQLQVGGQQANGTAMTNFSLTDVVRCDHGLAGRCMQCSGRIVQNMPLAMYSDFCAAYRTTVLGSLPPSSSVPSLPGPRRATPELSFAALASLIACLAPEPGERLLHLGSGTGRALVVWGLALQQGAASGIEPSPAFHQEAAATFGRLPPALQSRLFLHCGDIFASQEEWHQATTIFVSTNTFDDAYLARLAAGLQTVQEGTRVVAFSQPLCADLGRAPPGFALARHAPYCTTGTGNLSVYIYRKLATC
mmetsp:Transcript_130760/g.260870  ORF Transcript_130760/g.260870 Transcript_130760/m.260870 type:complete len:389 (-) Transcript_130760:164-1330(-)